MDLAISWRVKRPLRMLRQPPLQVGRVPDVKPIVFRGMQRADVKHQRAFYPESHVRRSLLRGTIILVQCFLRAIPLARHSFSVGGCSMKITEDVRKFAAEQGIAEEEALKKGMEAKSKEFVEKGAKVYAKA